jgi:hypothetical protein
MLAHWAIVQKPFPSADKFDVRYLKSSKVSGGRKRWGHFFILSVSQDCAKKTGINIARAQMESWSTPVT